MTTIVTKFPFVGSIATKQGGRSENQDNAGFVDTPLGLLLVVCDGMGGGPGGRTASLMAVDTILSVCSVVSEHTPREDTLRYAIEKANDIIYAKAKEIPELRGMGTTVAAVLVNEDSAVIAHAGDTRIYQLRKGAIVFRSSDHSVVANLVRQRKITEEEARNHPQSNIITRALGIRPSIEIEIDEVSFLRGDRFVLCTDGIWGMLPQRDLVKALSQVTGIDNLTCSLAEEIDRLGQANGGGHDNLTLAVLDTSFDSTIKKIKKSNNSENTNKTGDKTTIPSNRRKNIIILATMLFITVIAVVVFLILNHKGFRDSKEIAVKGITTTTVDDHVVVEVKDDDIEDNTEQIHYDAKEVMVNPFKGTTIVQKEEISRQVNHVIKNLDSLKAISDNSRKKSMEKKKKFVDNVLRPDVNCLEEKVIDEKKKNVKEILTLLNDRKTVSSDKHGQTTSEANKHIEIIKTKVRGLQN